jgi:hypothetical protein
MHRVPEDVDSYRECEWKRGGRADDTFERYSHHVGLDKKRLLMEDSPMRFRIVPYKTSWATARASATRSSRRHNDSISLAEHELTAA